MKVLIIITKAEIGGAQVFVLKLARSLVKKGAEVEIAAGDGDYLYNELDKEGIKYHRLNSLKRNINLFSFLFFISDLFMLLRKNHYDIIHLNSSNTLIGALSMIYLTKKPKSVFTFHGLSFLDEKYEISRIYKSVTKYFFKIILKHVDRSVFVSKNNYEIALKEKIVNTGTVIHNGLEEKEMSFLDPFQARKYFSEKCNKDLSSCFLIGSTGRLAYPKNYEFLIQNYKNIKARIPDVKFVIIGDGPNYEYYADLIGKNGCREDFILLGAIKESYQYIKGFDLFTLTSRYEGLSISMIEALYAGLPMLVSDIGGNREVLDGYNGQLYALDNIEDYINKLIKIRENKADIIEYNKQMKKRFTLEKMVSSYKELYEQELKK